MQNCVGVMDVMHFICLIQRHTYNYNAAYPLPLFNISNNHHYINENIVLVDEYFIE